MWYITGPESVLNFPILHPDFTHLAASSWPLPACSEWKMLIYLGLLLAPVDFRWKSKSVLCKGNCLLHCGQSSHIVCEINPYQKGLGCSRKNWAGTAWLGPDCSGSQRLLAFRGDFVSTRSDRQPEKQNVQERTWHPICIAAHRSGEQLGIA